MKYILFKGFDKFEVDADSVGLELDDGTVFELKYRKSDGEVSLSTDHQILIEPRAANVVRLGRKK